MKKLLTAAIITATLSGCVAVIDEREEVTVKNVESQNPKNIIMIVGDGMGPAYTTAYRYYSDNPNTKEIEETVFDRHLIGMASTYPARVSGFVTDSAAGATALATGHKSYNGAISVDVDKQPLETVLHRARKLGLKTGVAVTSQVNHATPASYLTHNEARRNYDAIADSYIDNGIQADVILGGGWKYFIREDRNLVNEFKENGFQYVDTYEALSSLNKNQPTLGLFADVGLPWALDDTDNHRLLALTKAATSQLENKNGYFLHLEASQVDWAGHANDVASAMWEMDDLAKTMEYLETYVQNNPDTLVVLTADHSTGGFTIAANGVYEWNPEVLRTMKMSPDAISKHFIDNDVTVKAASKLLNFEVTEEEVQKIQQAKYEGSEELAAYYQLSDEEKKKKWKPNLERIISKSIKKIIDARTNTGWTSSGHTAVDVPVFAFGPKSKNFSGNIDNTDVAKEIFKILEKK